MSKEKFKVYQGVFDEYTINVIGQIISRGYLDSLENLVKIGKEAEVYLGYKDGEKRAVKIYRVNNSTFKKISEYIKRDTRFKFGSSKFSRRTVLRWVEKEFRNLNKAHKENMLVPFPFYQKDNVLVMEFIEGDLLKNTDLEDPEKTYHLIKEQFTFLFKSNMIHGDFSEYNIMIKEGKQIPVMIDFGQCIYFQNRQDFGQYKDLFDRDLKNLINHFNKVYDLNLDFDEECESIVGE